MDPGYEPATAGLTHPATDKTRREWAAALRWAAGSRKLDELTRAAHHATADQIEACRLTPWADQPEPADQPAEQPPAALAPVLEALVVRPGDILIVRVPTRTTAAAGAALKQQLAEHLPDIQAKVIAAEQLALYRPEADDAA